MQMFGMAEKEMELVVMKSKAEKDSNKPKRPLSAVLVLMDSFRKDSNIKHVSMVGKGGGEGSLIAKAKYTKKIDTYNNPLAGEASDDSDNSQSEVSGAKQQEGEGVSEMSPLSLIASVTD
ncbi:high mobility group B protein 4-like [Aegilops tauschii subsp. strangulata]|uniref:high mobility group B protein 4-like n=1 Tax=Aegilops tauschii subsp. strangulata TaxID=200361 RepID=UPI001ABC6658|nr:high mobility group B protein 3-like [Aegilops tauschii subsp. strangulata]